MLKEQMAKVKLYEYESDVLCKLLHQLFTMLSYLFCCIKMHLTSVCIYFKFSELSMLNFSIITAVH